MLWNILIVMGITLVILGVSYGVEEFLWLRKAEFASGVVVEVIASTSGRNSRGLAPRVQYLANDGSEHEFTRGYKSHPPEFQPGDMVPVAYDPVTYQGRILTFGQRFGFAAIFNVVGLSLLALAMASIWGDQLVAGLCLK